jgi:hypothetical protein
MFVQNFKMQQFINLDGKEVDIIEDALVRQTRFVSAKL